METSNNALNSVIVGTGSYIPTKKVPNSDFQSNSFFMPNGDLIDAANGEITTKFQQITDIAERRYVTDDLVASDIGFYAAKCALESSEIDKESLDYIIVAHNFGDVKKDNRRSDFVPSIGARIKQKLQIENPYCIPYDIPFGCPGWLQGMIQANYFLKSGDAKRAMIIGAETLSRVSDPHDRDSMIYSDGAGATILEAQNSKSSAGILSHAVRSDTLVQASLLRMEESYNPEFSGSDLFLKMDGRKLYNHALTTVPQLVKDSIDKAGLSIGDISKVLIHQANAKMDEAILQRLFRLYGKSEIPQDVMPMTISWLGNSSVATVPTLLDLMLKGALNGHSWESGHNIVFASVGAGMNINSMVYKVP